MGGPEREEGQAATTGSLDLSLLDTGCRGRVWGLCCVGQLRSDHTGFAEKGQQWSLWGRELGVCPRAEERGAERLSPGLHLGESRQDLKGVGGL